MARFFLLFATFLGFCGIASACNAVARDFQQRHRQKCVKCPELTIPKTCEYDSIENNLTCGQTRIDYLTYMNGKEMCAKAIVHCSAQPLKTTDAYIAIEEKFDDLISCGEGSGKACPPFNKVFNDDVVEGSGEEGAFHRQRLDDVVEQQPSYVTISRENKYYTSATLTCNDNGEWEASELNNLKHEGVEKVHCIVTKV